MRFFKAVFNGFFNTIFFAERTGDEMRFRAWWWLCCLFALFSANAFAKVVPNDEMPAGQGAVFFHLAVNYPRANIGLIPASLISVEPVGVDKPSKFYLVGSTEAMQSSVDYFGSLPPGRYRFVDFSATVCKILCGQPLTPPPADIPEFEVRAGEVGYLGTIFFSKMAPLTAGPDQFVTTWGWHSFPDEDEGRRLFAGAHAALGEKPLRSGWFDSKPFAAANDRVLRIKGESAGMFLSGRHGDDGFYFGSQNGVIKRWKPGGVVELFDTGTDFTLSSVIETANGVILAGGEAGALRASSDRGKTWSDRGRNLPYGAIANLIALDDGDVLFTLSRRESVAIYRGRADAEAWAAQGWTKIAEFDMKFAFWTGLPGVQPQLFRHDSRLVLTLPSRKFAVLDLDGGNREVLDPPGSIGNFKVSPDGTLWCTCAKSIAMSPYLSRDFGKTWQPSEISRFMVLPEFFDTQRAFSYQGAIFSAKKTGVTTSTDGGKTWQFTHEPEINMAWWLPAYSRDGSIMLLHSLQVFGNSAIQLSKYSRDGGTTWQRIPLLARWVHEPAMVSTAGSENERVPPPAPPSTILVPPPPPSPEPGH